jgi:hypothetical protein
MRVVRRIFRMMGSEHCTLYAMKRAFEREGAPTPGGARFWHAKVIRNYLSEDVYKPHTRDEIMAMVDAGQMSAVVAASLDSNNSYCIWWFNRRRTRRTQVSEVGSNGEPTSRKKDQYVQRPKEEWVAVPVPDSGIPREWVDTVRDALKSNRVPSSAGRRVWEISGGIIKCVECGRNMMIHSVLALAPRAAASTTVAGRAIGTARRPAATASATAPTRRSRECGTLSPGFSRTQSASRPDSKR